MVHLTTTLCVAAASLSAVRALQHVNATAPRHLAQCTPLAGVDIVGHDLSHVTGVDASECCAKCSAIAGCQAYTWTRWNDGTCWFKSAAEPTHPNADAQSGAVARGNDQASCALQQNVDFVGNDIGDIGAATAGECCDKCRDVAGCHAFSWTDWNGGRCWLKSGRGETRRQDGVVSAVVEKTDDQCTIERGVDYAGFDIGNAPGANAGACCAQCEREPACRAFTWSGFNGGTCWLKSARGTATSSPGVDSGVVAKSDDQGQCKLERGVDFGGQDIGSAATPSAEMCCEQCAAKSGCAAFTWTNWNGGMCWFKAERGSSKSNAAAVSGVVAQRKEHVQYKIRRGEARVLSVNLGGWLDNVRNSLQFSTYLAARYKDSPAFLGLQLMNEPSFPTNYEVLWDYYKKAYEQIRSTGNDCIIGVSPMLQEQGPPVMDWFMPRPQYFNVWHEFHVYYKWGENEGSDENGVINRARGYRGHHLDNWKGNPIYMGEWSLAAPDSAPFHDENKLKEFAAVQLEQFEGAKAGWAFWSWRHDDEKTKLSQWSMRQLLRKGIFTVPRE
ncbi:hypothetical protein ATCC90586_006977 [Pythium insidiosum]|nr:hypothetical protein ATCC90586_006977 [Pythium insidiosum]